MTQENVSDDISRTTPICTEKVLFLTITRYRKRYLRRCDRCKLVVSSSLYFCKSVFKIPLHTVPCFSFRLDSILKWTVSLSNWKFPDCVHFFASMAKKIAVVYEHTKITRGCCWPIGSNNTGKGFFCAQSGASICLTVWKWSGDRVGTQGLPLRPVLENFCRAFSPAPGSPRMSMTETVSP